MNEQCREGWGGREGGGWSGGGVMWWCCATLEFPSAGALRVFELRLLFRLPPLHSAVKADEEPRVVPLELATTALLALPPTTGSGMKHGKTGQSTETEEGSAEEQPADMNGWRGARVKGADGLSTSRHIPFSVTRCTSTSGHISD